MTRFPIAPKNILIGLFVIVVLLAMLSLAGQYYVLGGGENEMFLKLAGKLNVDGEKNNLPNWFQSSAMVTCALLLMIIAMVRHNLKDRDYRYWCLLSLVFIYLSLDESISIHEQATVPLRQALDLHGPFFMSWVVPMSILTALFALFMYRFLYRQPANLRKMMVFSGFVFVSGALFMEMIDGAYYEKFVEVAGGQPDWPYVAMTTVEESLESIGLSFFLYALLSHLVSGTVMQRAKAPGKLNSLRSNPEFNLIKPSAASVRSGQTAR